ncbi:MAG: toll/interleukin-1 receptor domain-containing protein [Bryobacteraceae bacterium]
MSRAHSNPYTASRLARKILDCLAEGASVEIDGLGVFRPDGQGRFTFVPQTRPQIFIAYAVEDAVLADRLADELEARGFDPWLDRRKLLPGQNWPRSIERAIATAHCVIACLSKRSVGKRGFFQAEMRHALQCAALVPPGDIFFIPVRFDDCVAPPEIQGSIQYIDLFPDWVRGFERIVEAARRPRQAA